MPSPLYVKLACSGIRRNARLYVPYLVSGVFMVAMNYIALFLSSGTASRYQTTVGILSIMVVVMAIVSFVFLLYSNSILIKERKKEFGLFNVLGMEKRHIAMILLVETLITLIVVLIIGLVSGIVLSKLGLLLLGDLMGIATEAGFPISTMAIVYTVVFFTAIYFLTLLKMTFQVQVSKPIEMLRSMQVGEKQPRTKWVLAIAGVISLGAGYVLALVIKNPITAIAVFFLAVLLVVLGTYLLFMAASIAVLKVLRKRKNYYYRPNHFFSISGMIHRVKRNSVGLATICILSTMVLVIVSTTFTLYKGIDQTIHTMYPHEMSLMMSHRTATAADVDKAFQRAQSIADQEGRSLSDVQKQAWLSMDMVRTADGYKLSEKTGGDVTEVLITSSSSYEALSGEKTDLSADQCLVYRSDGYNSTSMDLLGSRFEATSLSNFPQTSDRDTYYVDVTMPVCYVVVADDAVLQDLYQAQLKAVGSGSASIISRGVYFDVDGSADQKLAYYKAVSDDSFISGNCSVRARQAQYESFYGLYGSLLFVGIFLGLVFLFMTALIVYYKQVSEGYEDRQGFEIMQNVGMTKREVRSTTHFQVLLVFFLPLVVAIIHTLVCAQDMVGILRLMAFSDVGLYIACVGGVAAIFAVVYIAVYVLTAKIYYHIVS